MRLQLASQNTRAVSRPDPPQWKNHWTVPTVLGPPSGENVNDTTMPPPPEFFIIVWHLATCVANYPGFVVQSGAISMVSHPVFTNCCLFQVLSHGLTVSVSGSIIALLIPEQSKAPAADYRHGRNIASVFARFIYGSIWQATLEGFALSGRLNSAILYCGW